MRRAIVFLICALLTFTLFTACDDTQTDGGGNDTSRTEGVNGEDGSADGENGGVTDGSDGDEITDELPWGGEGTVELPILPFE